MAAWFVLLTECNMVHVMEDDRMDGSSSRNGEEANCSTPTGKRKLWRHRHRLKHYSHRALTGRPGETYTLGGGLAHTAAAYDGEDFLCRRRRTDVRQHCSGKVRCRCYRLHGVPMACHLPHCECRALCSAPSSTEQNGITFIAIFISCVRKGHTSWWRQPLMLRHYVGLWCIWRCCR